VAVERVHRVAKMAGRQLAAAAVLVVAEGIARMAMFSISAMIPTAAVAAVVTKTTTSMATWALQARTAPLMAPQMRTEVKKMVLMAAEQVRLTETRSDAAAGVCVLAQLHALAQTAVAMTKMEADEACGVGGGVLLTSLKQRSLCTRPGMRVRASRLLWLMRQTTAPQRRVVQGLTEERGVVLGSVAVVMVARKATVGLVAETTLKTGMSTTRMSQRGHGGASEIGAGGQLRLLLERRSALRSARGAEERLHMMRTATAAQAGRAQAMMKQPVRGATCLGPARSGQTRALRGFSALSALGASTCRSWATASCIWPKDTASTWTHVVMREPLGHGLRSPGSALWSRVW
jgi:hypothetical protein